ncbi:hypothetical protein BJ742DRAFT_834575 [Cladochytrium replicatum]|nr:hypothetical protein BJ742DRAFT_834575 [Cladochytrium replicatum]
MKIKHLNTGKSGLDEAGMRHVEWECTEYWDKNPLRAFDVLAKMISAFHRQTSAALLKGLPDSNGPLINKGEYDMVIGEFFSVAAYDVAEAMEIPQAVIVHCYVVAFLRHYLQVDLPWNIPMGFAEVPAKTTVSTALSNFFWVGLAKFVLCPILESHSDAVRKEVGVLKRSLFKSIWEPPRAPPLVLMPTAIGPGLENPRSLPPHVHFMGPIVPAAQAMPSELGHWLDGYKAGKTRDSVADERPIVYVSMGTVVVLEEADIKNFLVGIAHKRFRVLWSLRVQGHDAAKRFHKMTAESFGMEELDVRIESYLPQAAVLAHPNVKLFVSHGGFNSTNEALLNGKPIVGVPFFGDQMYNIGQAVYGGACVKVSRRDSQMQNQLRDAILGMLDNYAQYKAAAMRMSALLKHGNGGLDYGVKMCEFVAEVGTTEHWIVHHNTVSTMTAIGLIGSVVTAAAVGLAYWIRKRL